MDPNKTLKAMGVCAVALVVILAAYGGSSSGSKSEAAATEQENPEPTRPMLGQEVSEEYFDWIDHEMVFKCEQQIKRLVRYDMRTPGIFSGTNSMDEQFFLLRFDQWSERVASDGTITMFGDEAEAQNGFGNWIKAHYSCTVNINTATVTDASIGNGRLN